MKSYKLTEGICMEKFRLLLILIVTTIINLHAQSLKLTGTVADAAGSPLEGVNVKLLEKNTTVTTNSSGNYIIEKVTQVTNSVTSASIVNLLNVLHNRLHITISEAGKAQFALYSLRGQLLRNVTFTGKTGETKTVDLSTIPQGIYIFSVFSKYHRSKGMLIHSGHSYTLSNVRNHIRSLSSVNSAKSRIPSIVDRLIFAKKGYASKYVGLESLNGKVDMTLSAPIVVEDTSDQFTDRDLEQNADLWNAHFYTLTSAKDITITKKGVYVLSGTATDVSIIVDVPDSVNAQLVLDGVEVINSKAPVVKVKSADKVFVTTLENSTNKMTFTGAAVVEINGTDTTTLDGVIFSKDDLTFNGLGTLNIVSQKTHGIVSKDDLKFTGGTVTVSAIDNGFRVNDSYRMASGEITVDSKTDALHIENNEDSNLGYFYMSGGTLNIKAGDEGIQASGYVQINAGTINIEKSGKGIEGSYIEINDGKFDITSSGHGIKAMDSINIAKGSITIDARKDGIHAENDKNKRLGSIKISGGNIIIKARDDGIRATTFVQVDGGTINVKSSTEGIEATYLLFNNGNITVKATDDGINAARKSSAQKVLIEVTGGKINVTVSGRDVDGFDSNGNMSLTGGEIRVKCPTNGPSGGFDADGRITLKGATVYINGVLTKDLSVY